VATTRNQTRFDEVTLQPRVLENVGARRLETRFLGRRHGLPFGIAPMGMCNLTHPDADRALARAASRFDIPLCLSSAASSSIEEMRDWAGIMRGFSFMSARRWSNRWIWSIVRRPRAMTR
jgi:isopentenyl diphosphate isomerase/L-lactate dehydrogenase-like FMN-dependent dehydrogenase